MCSGYRERNRAYTDDQYQQSAEQPFQFHNAALPYSGIFYNYYTPRNVDFQGDIHKIVKIISREYELPAYKLALCRHFTAAGIQNGGCIKQAVKPTGIVGDVGAADHQSAHTDIFVCDSCPASALRAEADEVAEAGIIKDLIFLAGVNGTGADVTVLCEDKGVDLAEDGNDLRCPAAQICADLGGIQLTIGLVAVGVAGDGVALFPQRLSDLLCTCDLVELNTFTKGLLCGGVGPS